MTKIEKAKILARHKTEQLNIDSLLSFYFDQKVEYLLRYSEEYLDDQLSMIKDHDIGK